MNKIWRRDFIRTGLSAGLLAGLNPYLISCTKNEEQEPGAIEDLMREHGILNRVLLIYEECIRRIESRLEFPPELLQQSSQIIKDFVEDYHEKQEEDFLFPIFEKQNQLTGLVKTLRHQHLSGRNITHQIFELSRSGLGSDEDERLAVQAMRKFIGFYRPHEAWEDTVLFPSLRKIISANQLEDLGEKFEKNEQQQFGQNGFELYIEKVSGIEKDLGINSLEHYNPDSFTH